VQSDPYLALLMVRERSEQELNEARQYRLGLRAPRSQRPGPVRSAVGRSLVRLGQRLSADDAPSFELARPR
jgi:hypothetical protein